MLAIGNASGHPDETQAMPALPLLASNSNSGKSRSLLILLILLIGIKNTKKPNVFNAPKLAGPLLIGC